MLEKKLLSYCRQHSIKLFADVTEWYSYSNCNTVGEYIAVHNVNHRIQHTDILIDGVIVISTYLKNYYSSRGVNSILIPPVFPPYELKKSSIKSNHLPRRIIYAGFPSGGKDDLLALVETLFSFNVAYPGRFVLDVIGPTLDYLKREYGDIISRAIDSNLMYVHGRLSRLELKKYERAADFMFLLRKNERYARAGFSTKFAEAVINGVIPICNEVGGCDSLIESGANGWRITDCSTRSICEVLCLIDQLPEERLLEMKRRVVSLGEDIFDRTKYVSEIKSFIQ